MSIRVRQAHSEVQSGDSDAPSYHDSLAAGGESRLAAEYVARASRLAPLCSRLARARPRPLPADLDPHYRLAYESPHNLALELSKSIALYGEADSIGGVGSLRSRDDDALWNGRPQQYFESMNYARTDSADSAAAIEDYDDDSLAP